jgi:hypothetical protein
MIRRLVGRAEDTFFAIDRRPNLEAKDTGGGKAEYETKNQQKKRREPDLIMCIEYELEFYENVRIGWHQAIDISFIAGYHSW